MFHLDILINWKSHIVGTNWKGHHFLLKTKNLNDL